MATDMCIMGPADNGDNEGEHAELLPELTRDMFLQAPGLPVLRVEVENWGAVYLRYLTGYELEKWQDLVQELIREKSQGTLKGLRGWLLVRTLADANGRRLFEDEDVDAILTKPAIVLEQLFEAARKLNRLDPETIEDEEKN